MGGFPGQSLLLPAAFAVVPQHENKPFIFLAFTQVQHGQIDIINLAPDVSKGYVQAFKVLAREEIRGLPLTLLTFDDGALEKILVLAVVPITQERTGSTIGIPDHTTGIHHQHAFLQHAENAVRPLLLLPQRLLNCQLMSDIAHDGNGPQGLVRRFDGSGHHIGPD